MRPGTRTWIPFHRDLEHYRYEKCISTCIEIKYSSVKTLKKIFYRDKRLQNTFYWYLNQKRLRNTDVRKTFKNIQQGPVNHMPGNRALKWPQNYTQSDLLNNFCLKNLFFIFILFHVNTQTFLFLTKKIIWQP